MAHEANVWEVIFWDVGEKFGAEAVGKPKFEEGGRSGKDEVAC